MGHQYTGNPAAFPVSFLVPDDGDPKTAASYNVGLQALGDRTKYLASQPASYLIEFTSSGTWVAPAGCNSVVIDACGGGGGGGGSGAAGIVAASSGCGGGGGAGALRDVRTVLVVPGTTYTITVGAGGNWGGVGSSGSNGASTSFLGGSTNEVWNGGGGGGATNSTFESVASYVYGGSPSPVPVIWVTRDHTVSTAAIAGTIQLSPGSGGAGMNALANSLGIGGTGNASNVGGAGGNAGASAGGYQGGGGGGGGGAGPFGPGALGGAGGTGDPAGGSSASYSGSVGLSASANSGAGGGGQGGSGSTLTNTGNLNHAGNGGSGRMRITYTKQAV